jgi:hypothetical protein
MSPPRFPDFPNTLTDFRKWWDKISVTHTFVIPDGISVAGNLFGPYGEIDGNVMLAPLRASGPLKEVELSVNYEPSHYHCDGCQTEIWPQTPRTDEFPFSLSGNIAESHVPGIIAPEIVLLPVATYREVEVDQGELVKSFANWHLGPYERSFRDLAQASQGLQDLDLEEARKILSEDATKGDEIFEAFGLKFPAGQVAFWGPLILLSVQLYLLAYLTQIPGRLQSSDPGSEILWIGTSKKPLARSIFFVTLFLLPIVAMASLAKSQVTKGWDRWIIVRDLYLIVAVVVSLFLGVWSWKCRPRV